MEMLVMVLVVVALVFAVKSFTKQGAKRKAEEAVAATNKSANDLTGDACEFITRANAARAFPEISPGNVNILPGEFALLRERATLFEQKTKRISSAVGTRIRVAKMPIYLGSGHSSSYEMTEPVANGEMVMTNKRMVFLATERSATIALKDVVGLEAGLGTISVHSAKRKTPHVFAVGNPALWALLAKIGASHPLESRFIPDGVTFKARPTGTPGEVDFEASSDQAAVGWA